MRTAAQAEALELLARVLEYPDGETSSLAAGAADRLTGHPAELDAALRSLAAWLAATPRGMVEERYTALFDLDPICTLDIGYHVFGDTYPRGAFIAGLAGELRARGLDKGQDLPDYLPTLLRLLARIEPIEDAGLLLEVGMRPGLEKIAAALSDSQDPWSQVLRALPAFLDVLVPPAPAAAPPDAAEVAAHA